MAAWNASTAPGQSLARRARMPRLYSFSASAESGDCRRSGIASGLGSAWLAGDGGPTSATRATRSAQSRVGVISKSSPCSSGKEDVLGRREAVDGRRVMLRQVIREESGRVEALDLEQP